MSTLRPSNEWRDDDGAVLWTRLPIVEPPYCGTPGDSDWPYMGKEWANLQWAPLPDVFAPSPRGDRHTVIVIAEDRVIVERFRGTEDEAASRAEGLAEKHDADANWHVIDGWVEIELDSETIADPEPEDDDQHLACEGPRTISDDARAMAEDWVRGEIGDTGDEDDGA